MTQDQIRKLLGGYATNELSADERRILFEAALDDQELFNALQNEDALKELLDDPVSREHARRALAGPLPIQRRPAFGSRRWLLGVAIPAVAAVVLIAVMNRATAPVQVEPPLQIAAVRPSAPQQAAASRVEVAAPVAKKQATKVKIPAAASPLPSRAIQPESSTAAVVSLRVPGFAQIPDAVRQQMTTGIAANAPLYQGPLVRYSVVRSGAAGEEIRVGVITGIAGYLALYQMDSAGNSKRVYPANEPAVRVLPGIEIQIPSAPIRIPDAGERLRLVVLPISRIGGAVGGFTNGVLSEPTSISPAPLVPLVVEIPLAPN